jgi:acetyl esterase/lipase
MKRCATLALLTVITAGAASAAEPVELSAFIALKRPEPTLQVRYGAERAQGIDIFLPAGSGPHPVAILIHGGCWSMATSGREQLRHLGADLAERGIAVWSLGYRRANEAGAAIPALSRMSAPRSTAYVRMRRHTISTCRAQCWSAIQPAGTWLFGLRPGRGSRRQARCMCPRRSCLGR